MPNDEPTAKGIFASEKTGAGKADTPLDTMQTGR